MSAQATPLLRLILVLAAAIMPVPVLAAWRHRALARPNLLLESYTLRTALLFGSATTGAAVGSISLSAIVALLLSAVGLLRSRHRAVLLPRKNPCASGLHSSAALVPGTVLRWAFRSR